MPENKKGEPRKLRQAHRKIFLLEGRRCGRGRRSGEPLRLVLALRCLQGLVAEELLWGLFPCLLVFAFSPASRWAAARHRKCGMPLCRMLAPSATDFTACFCDLMDMPSRITPALPGAEKPPDFLSSTCSRSSSVMDERVGTSLGVSPSFRSADDSGWVHFNACLTPVRSKTHRQDQV